MTTPLRRDAPEPLRRWKDRALPEAGWPAGYSALLDHYGLRVPPPPYLTMIAERHEPSPSSDWQVLPRRLRPDDTVEAHLEFALKYEGLNLLVLKALFERASSDTLVSLVRESPTGKYTRRLWFLYEWLTGRRLEVPDLQGRPQAVPVVDSSMQVALSDGELSKRHRVRNNLPGTARFCPMVRWTDHLRSLAAEELDKQAREVVGRTHPDVVARAAAFLLVSDSQSSFEIEGETPPQDRARRWGQAIAEAGSRELTVDELVRLQRIVIGDDRFVHIGLREEGGFVGPRDRRTRDPLPEHISARPQDLRDLIEAILAYEKRATSDGIDPVIAAAVVAFGFVYVHPFEDGNGRIHRWLIHHVLAGADYNPPEFPFPVSAAILRNLSMYRQTLESYSRPLLNCIEWEVTERKNVRALNDTADYYRFFDATAQAEFLYRSVSETVKHDLPEEVAYLEAYDRFVERVQQIVDMPSDTVDLLHRFLRQNEGALSQRARTKEFGALTPDEVREIEQIHNECFK
jgi:Fic/DOC family